MEKILVLANKDFNGVYSALLLKHMVDEKVEIRFPYDFIKELEGVSENYNVVVLLGFGVEFRQLQSIQGHIQDMIGVPFASVYHFATWGVAIPGAHSYVIEDDSYIKTMYSKLGTHEDAELIPIKDVVGYEYEDRVGDFLDAVNNYQLYQFTKESYTQELVTLHDLFRQHLVFVDDVPKLIEDNKEAIEIHKKVIEDKIVNILRNVRLDVVNGFLIAVVYTNEHVNEVAHQIINTYMDAGYHDVLVFVGRRTRGSDLFSVRGSGRVHVGDICSQLDKSGKGKEKVGTVFLGDTSTATANIITHTLADLL